MPHNDSTTKTSPVAAAPDTDPSVPVAAIDRAAVEKVIEIMRPAIQADDGDIFLRGVDTTTGVVSVELVGACVTCPASTATLKDGIERILRQRVEGVTAVEHVGASLVGTDDGTPVHL